MARVGGFSNRRQPLAAKAVPRTSRCRSVELAPVSSQDGGSRVRSAR